MYTTIDDIRNQVITTKAGQVKLGDIAVIEKGYLDPRFQYHARKRKTCYRYRCLYRPATGRSADR